MEFIVATISAFIIQTHAQSTQDQRKGHHPPAEALKACEGKSADTECEFSTPRGAAKGKCFSPSSDKPLACKPQNKAEK